MLATSRHRTIARPPEPPPGTMMVLRRDGSCGPAPKVRTAGLAATRVHVGAPIGPVSEDWPEVRTYANRIDFYARSLNADADKQIVYTDPTALEDMIAKAKASGGMIGGLTLAALEALHAKMLARQKARGGQAQAKKDAAWASKWQPFVDEWRAWYENVNSVSPAGIFTFKTLTAQQAWQEQQHYEQRLRILEAEFLALGGTVVTNPVPAVLVTPTGKPEEPLLAGIPWTSLLVVAGLFAGAQLLGAFKK